MLSTETQTTSKYVIKREALLSKVFAMEDKEKRFIFMHICLTVEDRKQTIANPSILLPVFQRGVKDSLQWLLHGDRMVDISIASPIGIDVTYTTPNNCETTHITRKKLCVELGEEIQKHCLEILIPFITITEKSLCH
jgi:hypothetical protein